MPDVNMNIGGDGTSDNPPPGPGIPSDPTDQTTPPGTSGNGQPLRPAIKCGARGRKRAYLFYYQPDITPAELAASTELIMFGFASMIRAATPETVDILYDALSAETKRHWKVAEIKQQPQVVGVQQAKRLHLPPGARG